MDRVYSKNNELDDFTKDFIHKVVSADEGNNPDMKVEFKGFRHDNLGFTVALHNMEVFSDSLTQAWHDIASESGMTLTVKNDMVNGEVVIKCQRIQRRRTPIRKRPISAGSFSYPPLKTIIYISLSIVCIYLLWTRHSDQLLQ
jgi:hypothetical protein